MSLSSRGAAPLPPGHRAPKESKRQIACKEYNRQSRSLYTKSRPRPRVADPPPALPRVHRDLAPKTRSPPPPSLPAHVAQPRAPRALAAPTARPPGALLFAAPCLGLPLRAPRVGLAPRAAPPPRPARDSLRAPRACAARAPRAPRPLRAPPMLAARGSARLLVLLARARGLLLVLLRGALAALAALRRARVALCAVAAAAAAGGVRAVRAHVGGGGGGVGVAGKPPVERGLVIAACALFVVGAALAAAETAITTLWPWKVRELAEKEGEDSPFAVLQKDLTRFLTTILVATTSATIFSTAIATELAGQVYGAASVGYVTAGMTVFFLFFGEILPKALSVHSPQRVARVMVPVISVISVIVYPVGKVLASLSTTILRVFKLPMESDGAVSEEELRLIVAGADRSGSIEKYESQIIKNVLDLEETAVRNVMCPRVDIVALDATTSLTELLREEEQTHYSRMPVFDRTIDNIIGVVLSKSLLKYLNAPEAIGALETTQVASVMEPAFFVPESMSVWIVLEEMRKRRLHMAIVVDEYGGTAGIVTLEDILEEVVGEIYDEDDDVEADRRDIQPLESGGLKIDGQAELEKVGDALSLDISEDDLRDYGTISGYLCARMGGIPQQGDVVVVHKVRFTVREADDRRILSVGTEMLGDQELADIAAADALRAQHLATDRAADDPDPLDPAPPHAPPPARRRDARDANTPRDGADAPPQ